MITLNAPYLNRKIRQKSDTQIWEKIFIRNAVRLFHEVQDSHVKDRMVDMGRLKIAYNYTSTEWILREKPKTIQRIFRPPHAWSWLSYDDKVQYNTEIIGLTSPCTSYNSINKDDIRYNHTTFSFPSQ